MTKRVISHVTVGVNDVTRAVDFYDRVLITLDIEKRWQGDVVVGYGPGSKEGIDPFWINRPLNGQAASVGNGSNACNMRDLDGHKIAAVCHDHA
ncbi:MAG: hypothetical protein ACR2PZ_13875 [Pseudomonadales bacterium]